MSRRSRRFPKHQQHRGDSWKNLSAAIAYSRFNQIYCSGEVKSHDTSLLASWTSLRFDLYFSLTNSSSRSLNFSTVMKKKLVLKVDVDDEKIKQKAMKLVSNISGVESIAINMNEAKMTVIGDVDPVVVVSKLRKFRYTELLTIGPPEAPEKKDTSKTDEPVTVIGDVDPVVVGSELRKFHHAELLTIVPPEAPEKKDTSKTDEPVNSSEIVKERIGSIVLYDIMEGPEKKDTSRTDEHVMSYEIVKERIGRIVVYYIVEGPEKKNDPNKDEPKKADEKEKEKTKKKVSFVPTHDLNKLDYSTCSLTLRATPDPNKGEPNKTDEKGKEKPKEWEEMRQKAEVLIRKKDFILQLVLSYPMKPEARANKENFVEHLEFPFSSMKQDMRRLQAKKLVLKVDIHYEKIKQKAMKLVSSISGVETIAMDMNEKKLTVTGDVDPVAVVCKLRKVCHAEILTIGTVKELEKKDKSKKDEPVNSYETVKGGMGITTVFQFMKGLWNKNDPNKDEPKKAIGRFGVVTKADEKEKEKPTGRKETRQIAEDWMKEPEKKVSFVPTHDLNKLQIQSSTCSSTLRATPDPNKDEPNKTDEKGKEKPKEWEEMRQKAEVLIRKKDFILQLVLSYPMKPEARANKENFVEQLEFSFSSMKQDMRRLQALLSNKNIYDKHKSEISEKIKIEMGDLLFNIERSLAIYDFHVVVGLTRQTSGCTFEVPDEMLTLAIDSAICQVSKCFEDGILRKIGISGSEGEKVAKALIDRPTNRAKFSVVLCVCVSRHHSSEEVWQNIAKQIHGLEETDDIFKDPLAFNHKLLPEEFLLLVDCVDGQADLHDLRIPDHGFVVLTTPSQNVYEIMELDLVEELPSQIGALGNLEEFDLEGTRIIYLPKEIGKLVNLTCFKVSFCGRANRYRKTKQIETTIPIGVLPNLCRLNELSIDVNPDGEWWDVDVKAILNELSSSKELRILELYLPSVELLQQIRRWDNTNLHQFTFTVGRHRQRIISRLPHEVEEISKKWKKHNNCLEYINGEDMPFEITEALNHATFFFLQRHWTVKMLSEFRNEMLKLKICLLVECNELQTIIDGNYEHQSGVNKEPIFKCLEYLGIHYMKNLESICRSSIDEACLTNLISLSLHTCPNLTTIFTPYLVRNLNNLKDLIVEDCCKIKSIVCQEFSDLKFGYAFLRLERMSLLNLPELVSISGGLSIGVMESLVIYNWSKLEILYATEVSSNNLKIKGEKDWWDKLKWHESNTLPAYDFIKTLW
ncbi:unnamed protein product [Camellia sinensis]